MRLAMHQGRTKRTDILNQVVDSQRFTEIPRTKFHIPVVRPNVLDRRQLMEILEQGLYRKLTLLCAPAGFGKTTLAARFLGDTSRHSVWISLHSRDDDPIRLCRVLAAAFSMHLSKDIEDRWGALDWTVASHELFLSILINSLEQHSTPFLLVLDDWHEVQSDLCQQMIVDLIERCPAHGHILVTTRHRPSWPLHRWRARDWVQEFSADMLRFSREEVLAFFHHTMQLPISQAEGDLLQQRTEGWVVGLQLVGLSLRHHPLACLRTEVVTSNNPYLAEYLRNEVLQQISPEDREFLLQVSILHRLCGSLCDHVIGQTQSSERLRWLEQNNLFVSAVSLGGDWFSLHPLWSEFLQHELARLGPERGMELHRRASQWWTQHGGREEAIEHAMSAQAWDLCLALLQPHLEELLFRQEFSRVQTLLEKLPVFVRQQSPALSISWLWACLGLGEWAEAMEQELSSLLQGVASATKATYSTQAGSPFAVPPSPEALHHRDQFHEHGEVLCAVDEAELLFLRTHLAALQGDFAASLAYAQQALAMLPSHRIHMRFTLLGMLGREPSWLATQECSDVWFEQGLKTIEPHLSSPEQKAFFQHRKQIFQSWLKYHRGQLKEAIQDLESVRAKVSKPYESCFRWETAVLLAYFYWEQGQLEQAWVCVQEAEQSFDPEKYDGVAMGLYQTAALVYHTVGEREKAYACLEQATTQHIKPSAREFHLLEQTRLYLKSLEGDFQYVVDWVHRSGIAVSDEVDLVREERQVEYLILAWVLFVEQRMEELETLLLRMTEQLHVSSQVPMAVTLQVSWALVRDCQGQRVTALTHLREALRLASLGGYLSTFFTQEELLRDLLCELLQAPVLLQEVCSQEFLAQLRSCLPSVDERLTATRSLVPQTQHRILPSGPSVVLSKREIEILTVAAEGQTYRDIAQSLHISAETVKQHMKNIFQKLQVNNRTQALAKARTLRLFSSVSS